MILYAQVVSNYEVYDVEIELDPTIQDAGEIDGIPVFKGDDDVWQPAPGYEEELQEVLDQQSS